MLILTVVLGLAGLRAASGRPQEPYFVSPNYIQAVESLPLATEAPVEPDEILSERRQAERRILNGIRSHILVSLDMPCTPSGPPDSAISPSRLRSLQRLVNRVQHQRRTDRNDLLKRAQSFYPSCDHPAEDDPRVARLMPSLDVFFNLTSFFPTVTDDVTIEQSELRVFKIPGPGRSTRRPGRRRQQARQEQTVRVSLHAYTSPNNGSSRPQGADVTPWSADVTPWSAGSSPWSSPDQASSDVTPWSSDVSPWSSDVTPWSGAPGTAGASGASGTSGHSLRSPDHQGRDQDQDGPRLVDRLTVPASRRGWLTFDVLSAVRAWKMGAHNWGFLLTVEDLSGRQLSPADFFQDMECDVAVPSSPVPGLLVQAAEAADLEMQSEPRYPVLDLVVTSEPPADAPLPGDAPNGAEEPCAPSTDRRSRPAVPRRRHRHGLRRRNVDRRHRQR